MDVQPLEKKFVGYAVVYRTDPNYHGVDEYLVVEDFGRKSCTRTCYLNKATLFDDPKQAGEWARFFISGGIGYCEACPVPVWLEYRHIIGELPLNAVIGGGKEALLRLLRCEF